MHHNYIYISSPAALSSAWAPSPRPPSGYGVTSEASGTNFDYLDGAEILEKAEHLPRTPQQPERLRIGFWAVDVSGRGSGAWNRLETLTAALSRRDELDIHVVVSEDALAESLRSKGVTASLYPRRAAVQRFLLTGKAHREFVDRYDLDVIHFESTPASRIEEALTILSVHDLRDFYLPLGKIRTLSQVYNRLFLARDTRRSDVVLTLSESSKHDVARFLSASSKIAVLPCGVDPPPSDCREWPVSVPRHTPYVLALGHLEYRKNLEVLVRAKASPNWPEGVELVLAGSDQGSRLPLESIADDLGPTVTFTGPVSEDEKWALLSHATAVAVPSLVEGFGIVAVEAGLAGSPVLVSDRTSLPEIYNMPEITLPADSPEMWATTVHRCWSDENWVRDVAREQSKIALDYRPDAVAERLVRIYAEVLDPAA